jgi:tetratricopeptide (TPR) repeat protein
MTSAAKTSSPTNASFEERLGILTEELELAVKWERPCILLVVYSSEFVRADVERRLENSLLNLGQKSAHFSVRARSPKGLAALFKELKNPRRSVFMVDGLHWGYAGDSEAYEALGAQREYLIERRIRIVFWLTQEEIPQLAHAAPEFWTRRHRVIEFVETPKPEQLLPQSADSTWQGPAESSDYDDTDAKLELRESMLSEVPDGEESVAVRGNLLLGMAVLNWRKGDYATAEQQLREALSLATHAQDGEFEAECFNALALIQSGTERIDEAIESYKQALELAPTKVFVWNNLGSLCTSLGRNDEAMIAFRKALQADPHDAVSWNGLANVHAAIGYTKEAIAAYRKAIQYAPTLAQPWCGLGAVYEDSGQSDEAVKSFQKAVELNPRYLTAWLRLGAHFARRGKDRDAIKAYQKALDLDRNNSQTWNELGKIHLSAESYDEAAQAFSKAVELDRGNGWAYGNLALANVRQGKPKEAVSLLLRSIELLDGNSDKAACWNRLGGVYRLLNDYDNAVNAYQMADQLAGIEDGPDAGQTERALEPEDVMEDQAAESADTNQETGGAVTAPEPEREPDQEIAGGQDAAKDAPLLNEAAEAPTWIFQDTNENRTVDPAVASMPNSSEEAAAQAEARDTQPSGQDTTQAGPEMEASMNAAGWTEKANALFNQGQYDEASAAYERAIELDPTYGVPYSNLALTYLTQGQPAKAIQFFQRSIEYLKSDRDKALSWNGLGNAYRGIGDYAHAVAAYRQAAELDPDTSGIRDGANNNQSSEVPTSGQTWLELGEALLRTGAADRAIAALQKAIELEPGAGLAYSKLARALASQGKHREAVPYYEKSIDLLQDRKDKADALNGLGNAYRKLNDYQSAIRSYQQAVALRDEGMDLLTRTRFSLLSNVYADQ